MSASVRVRPRPSASVRVRPRPSASVRVRRIHKAGRYGSFKYDSLWCVHFWAT